MTGTMLHEKKISIMKPSDQRVLEFIFFCRMRSVVEWSPGAGLLIMLLMDWVVMATDEKSVFNSSG